VDGCCYQPLFLEQQIFEYRGNGVESTMNKPILHPSLPKRCLIRKPLACISILAMVFVQISSSQPSLIDIQSNSRPFYAILQMLLDSAKSSPQLKAADATVQAAAAAVKGKRSLEPPQIAVEFYQSPLRTFPNPFNGQMEYDYSIQQMIPFPGKLGVMAKEEEKRAEMLKSDRTTLERDIILRVKSFFYELYLKNRQIEVNHETLALVRNIVAVSLKQYELGMGRQSDVLRAQTELSTLANDSIILVQERRSMEGMLNAVCNRPVDAPIGFIPRIDPAAPDFSLDRLLAVAEKYRPELASMERNVEMRQAQRSAARREFLPDFMVRGMYRQMMMTQDSWDLMIGATVPIAPWSFYKYSSGSTAAAADERSAWSEKKNMENMIAAEVNDALSKLQSARERLMLTRKTTIPQAEQAFQSALAGYQTGKQEFTMLIDVERMLVMAKLDYHMAVMTLLTSLAQLERAVGMDIAEIERIAQGGRP
jgi:outer membrane protein, heavy metal efflux system